MSAPPSTEAVRKALQAAEQAAQSYVDEYPAVEAVDWPEDEVTLRAEARTILARLRSQVDSIRYEASTDVDEDDIDEIQDAMLYLRAMLNEKSVDEYR